MHLRLFIRHSVISEIDASTRNKTLLQNTIVISEPEYRFGAHTTVIVEFVIYRS